MTKVKAITSKAQFDDLVASGKLIYIDFYTTWCGPCKTISPVFDKLAEKHHEEGNVEFYNVDIDEVTDLAQHLKVRSIPTFHAYKNGNQVGDALVGANQGALGTLVQKGLDH